MIKINYHGGDIYKYTQHVIDFSSNINPLGIPKSFRDALTDNLSCIERYPDLHYRKLTASIEKYLQIEKILKNRLKKVEFFNTICYATRERQDAARELSKTVDAMIVIGGKSSSNTKKLAEICSENCITFLIETAKDIDLEKISSFSTIGITAGASTPDFIIDEVKDLLLTK